MEPVVRIIIPTYNRANLISEAILSVLSQTFQQFELFVVDDGSNDNTSEVVKKIAENDSRIKYLYQNNRGAASARNYGISQESPPEYIAFLDSDDIWYPRHLESSVNFLDTYPELLLVSARMNIVDNLGQYTKEGGVQQHNKSLGAILETARKLHIPHAYILDTLACKHALICDQLTLRTSCVVVRANMISAPLWFDPELIVLEDIDFFIRMSNSPFGFLDETHGRYRHFGDNLTGLRDLKSSEMLKRQLSVLTFHEKKLGLAADVEDKLIIMKKIADTAYLVGQCMSEQKDKRSAIVRMYIKSLRNKFSLLIIRSLIGIFIPESLKKYLRVFT